MALVTRIAGECTRYPLWKRSLGRDRVLYKYDGHIRKTIRQKLQWGSASMRSGELVQSRKTAQADERSGSLTQSAL